MTDTLSFDETELAALIDLADGRLIDAATATAALAPLIERGLATVEGDEVIFAEAMQSAFEALASCKVNVLLMNAAGEPFDQYYLGEAEAGARVSMVGDGLGFERIEAEALPAIIASSLVAHLTAAEPSPPPNADTFEALAAALDLEGLQPLAWGGLTINHGDGAAPPDWVLVIRTEPGYVWEHAEREVIAFAGSEEDLAELAAEALLE